MKKTKIYLSVILIFATLLYLPSSLQVHAATGTVCLVSPGTTSCPVFPASLTGTIGGQLRVAVLIQGSDALNGFDVTLLADHTILAPAGVDLTGSIIAGGSTLVECLGGIIVQGNTCSPTDTIDTLHLAAVASPGVLLPAPVTGLLFTAIYNITSTTTGTTLDFQTGCTGTSVQPNVCVTIGNGTITPPAETVQTATFATSTAPDFTMAANPSSLTITAGSSGTSTLSITSVNGFAGTINLAATVSPSGPATSLSPTSVALASGQTITATLTVSTSTSTTPQKYFVTLNGTSGSLIHLVTVTVTVNPPPIPDFTITASPANLLMQAGSTGTSTITLASINGFTGSITLISAITPSGPTTSLSASSVTLSSGGTATTILTVSTTSSTPSGSYTAQVTGTSVSTSHAVQIPVTVNTPTPAEVCVIQPGATSCPANVLSFSGTAGTQLRVSVFIQGSNALNGFDITLLANHAILQPADASLAGTILPGTASIVVKCIGGVLVQGSTCLPATDTVDTIHFAAIAGPGQITTAPTTGLLFTAIYNVVTTTSGTPINFQTGCSNTSVTGGICVTISNGTMTPDPESIPPSQNPSFTITANPTTFTIPRGSQNATMITLTSIGGFAGTISLSTTISPNGHHGPAAILAANSFTIGAGGQASVALTIRTTRHTAPGTYTITVTGTSGSLSKSVTITVTVT